MRWVVFGAVLVLVLLGCSGHQRRTENAARYVRASAQVVHELDLIMVQAFASRRGTCDADCLGRWMSFAAALESARYAVLSADDALRAGRAADDGQVGALVGCAGAAVGRALDAAAAVGVRIDASAQLASWRDYADLMGSLCRVMDTGTVGRGSAEGGG